MRTYEIKDDLNRVIGVGVEINNEVVVSFHQTRFTTEQFKNQFDGRTLRVRDTNPQGLRLVPAVVQERQAA